MINIDGEQHDIISEKLIQKKLNLFLNPIEFKDEDHQKNPTKQFINQINSDLRISREMGNLKVKSNALKIQNQVNQNCKACIKIHEQALNHVCNHKNQLKMQSPNNQMPTDVDKYNIAKQSHKNSLQAQFSNKIHNKNLCSIHNDFKTNETMNIDKRNDIQNIQDKNFLDRQQIFLTKRKSFDKFIDNNENVKNYELNQIPLKKLNQNKKYQDELVQRYNSRKLNPKSNKISKSFENILMKYQKSK